MPVKNEVEEIVKLSEMTNEDDLLALKSDCVHIRNLYYLKAIPYHFLLSCKCYRTVRTWQKSFGGKGTIEMRLALANLKDKLKPIKEPTENL